MKDNKPQGNLIRIAQNRHISIEALNKKKPFYSKVGRPKQSDYLLSDITPKQRTELNKMLTKPRYMVVRNKRGFSVRLILALVIPLMVAGWGYYMSTKNVMAEEFVSPIAKTAPVVIEVPSYCEGEINSIFCEYKDWDAKKMIAICTSENGFKMWGNKWNPNAQYTGNNNGSVDTGICMVNSIHGHDAESLKDARFNIEVAHKIWLRRPDYTAWSDFNNGRYLPYYEEL